MLHRTTIFNLSLAYIALLVSNYLAAQQIITQDGANRATLTETKGSPQIVITPTSFSQELEMGATTTRLLNIANTGDADLSFIIDIGTPNRTQNLSYPFRYSRAQVYYDQTGNPSTESGAMSQNPIDKPEVLSHAADDFLVPQGETWTVNHIYTAGLSYSGCYVIIDLVDVVFYTDSSGLPGDTLFSYDLIHPHCDFTGNLNIFLPTPAILSEGNYWVSVVAHVPYYTSVFWNWKKETAPTIHNEFAWERPNATSGCTSWCPASVQWPTKVDFNLTFALTDSIYVPSNEWLSADVVSGTVPAGSDLNIEFTFDAGTIQYDSTNAPYGLYSAEIRVASNDPESPIVNVPSSLTVIDPRPLPMAEDWETGSFHTHGWTVDPIHVNWNSNSSQGNPGLTARFLNSTAVSNYSMSMISPYLDARNIFDNVTLKYDIYLENGNTATLEKVTVEVYNGTGWIIVDDNDNSEGTFQYRTKSVNITDLAAGNIFKVRFRANGSNSSSVKWWYVDNVHVYQQVVGNISGIMTHFSDGTPVEGANIVLMNSASGKYTSMTSADGSYSFMGVEEGTYTLVIQKEGYNVISDEVIISYGLTTDADYQMTAPQMAVAPTSIDISLLINQTVTDTIIIYNEGNGPLSWNGGVQPGKKHRMVPASDGNYKRSQDSISFGPAPGLTLGVPPTVARDIRGSTGYAFDIINSALISFDTEDPLNQTVISSVSVIPHCGTFDAFNANFMYIIDDTDGSLKKVDVTNGDVTDIGSCNPHNNMYTWTGITIDKSTNQMYGVCTNGPQSYLALIDMHTAIATDIGPMNVPLIIDIAIDGTGQMYGYDIAYDQAYMIDKETGQCYLIGAIGFDANYAQGMSWNPEDDNLYLVGFNGAEERGELRILDRLTGNTILVGTLGSEIDALGFPGVRGCDWAVIEPASGVVPAHSSQELIITFDGSYIPPQQKDLNVSEELVFNSEPSVGQQTVALSMTIEGEFFGLLSGIVTHGFGGTPIDSVMITAIREEGEVEYTYSLQSDNEGLFQFDHMIYGVYSISAERKGYHPYTFSGVVVQGGQTTTHMISMVSPTMIVDPQEIVVTSSFGEIVTRSVEIMNSGDGTLTWEADYARSDRQQISIPASDGQFPRGKNPISYKRNPHFKPTSVIGSVPIIRGSMGYAFDIWNYAFFSFDTDDPATQNYINSMEYTPFGGTFDEIHTDFMYIIDYNDSMLKSVDIATGTATTIGPAGLLSDPTGLTCDKTDGTLYASSTNGTESMLYKINPMTGASTVIGATGIPILIDITIDGEGQMYGYDISGDNAYKIDKRTGASELLGSIGFDANYAQGMCWDPGTDLIFLSAYSDESGNGELRVMDKITGNTEYLGDLNTEVDALAFPGGGSAWLTLAPKSGTVLPGETQEIIATLDGNYVPSKRDYTLTRDITFISHPDVGKSILPVTFTITADIYGVLAGTVTHAGLPVGEATITAHKYGSNYTTVAGSDGNFIFQEILEGIYDISVETNGYCTFQTAGVVIVSGQTTTLDILLQAPTMVIDPTDLSITLPKNTMKDRMIQLTNNGDCQLLWDSQLTLVDNSPLIPLEFIQVPRVDQHPTADISPNSTIVLGPQIRDQWDILFTFDCNNAAQYGLETDGQYIYTSSWLPGFGTWFHKYSSDGTWIEDFDIEGVTGVFDLAWDGQYFYGGNNGPKIYQMDFTNKELIGIINTVIPNVRHIAYDPQADAFWTGGWDHLWLVDRSGEVVVVTPYGLMGMAGSAYDPWSPGGPFLWLFNQTIGGNRAELYQFSIPNNALTGVTHDASDVPGYIQGGNAGGLCISDEVIPGKIALIGNIQLSPNLVFAYDLVEPPVPGITRSPFSGSIDPGYNQVVTVHFDATGLEEGVYSADLIFSSFPDVGASTVPITLTVISDIPVLSVTPVNQDVSFDTGMATFTVNNLAGGDMNYTATITSGNEWLSITEGETGLNFGIIKVTFMENTSLLSRTGTVTITAPGATGSPVNVTLTQSASPGPPPGITISEVNVQEIGAFTVPVSVENITNLGFFRFTIDYDSTILSFMNITNWYSGMETATVNNPAEGHITFVWSADQNGIDIPAGILFDLNFNWTAPESFITEITWSDYPESREFRYLNGELFVPEYESGTATRSDGISEIDASAIQVFPNPASGQFFVLVPNGISDLRIMSCLGKMVHSERVAKNKKITINTSFYPAGNYFLCFDTYYGSTIMKKIVIIK
ncbi:MAG TPA: carboxypeptidase regulatory-like domain-containing protein [Bacteroidales bacterium]|nr:carboxypeptidase regulatory-like domain-containing protein [Bacteroidales bacterium]